MHPKVGVPDHRPHARSQMAGCGFLLVDKAHSAITADDYPSGIGLLNIDRGFVRKKHRDIVELMLGGFSHCSQFVRQAIRFIRHQLGVKAIKGFRIAYQTKLLCCALLNYFKHHAADICQRSGGAVSIERGSGVERHAGLHILRGRRAASQQASNQGQSRNIESA